MRANSLLVGIASLLLAASGLAAAAPRVPAFIKAAVADASRPEEDRARDADRKPAETLAFAGVRPGMKIAELAPGGGYFTRMLTNAVGPKGKVYGLSTRSSAALEDYAKTHPTFRFITIQPVNVPVPEPVDLFWTTLNYHDFKNLRAGDVDAAAAYNAVAFKMLKPGGIYLINDHHGAAGTGATQTRTHHRIEMAQVIKEVEAAGFKLDAQSDILRHPDDNRAAPISDSTRGKTDQFLLRFRKPR